jgi:small-conductance mechanosensitive channel
LPARLFFRRKPTKGFPKMTLQDLARWLENTTVWGLSLTNIALALAAALFAYLAMTLGLRFALSRLEALAARTHITADDTFVAVLRNTSRWLLTLVALLIGLGMLELPLRWQGRVGQLWFVVVALQVALWLNMAIGLGLQRHLMRQGPSGATPVSASATLLSWGLRTLLWSVALLAMLSNLGVNVTAFIASLGVGGIAIALAAQNILGDLFASMAIAIDKPFEVGDFITMDGVAGTVEMVGVKTTRIRSLGGEQVVLSNTELLKKTVSNYKRLQERRIVFTFGVTYDTTAEQAEAIPGIVQRAVQASERLRFDRAHFKAFGESSLDYEVVYIVLVPEFGIYMDEQQRINLALMRELEALGVGFAFPTRTLHVASMPEPVLARAPAPAPARPFPVGPQAA